jgi:hypothetical protein
MTIIGSGSGVYQSVLDGPPQILRENSPSSDKTQGISSSFFSSLASVKQKIDKKINTVRQYQFKESFSSHLEEAKEKLTNVKENLRAGLQSAYSKAKTHLHSPNGELKSKFHEHYQACSQHLEKAKDAISEVLSSVKDGVQDLKSQGKDQINHVKTMLEEKIQTADMQIFQAKIDIHNEIFKLDLAISLPIAGFSGRLEELGKDIGEQLESVKKSLTQAKNSITEKLNSTSASFIQQTAKKADHAASGLTSIGKEIDQQLDNVKSSLTQAKTSITEKLNSAIHQMARKPDHAASEREPKTELQETFNNLVRQIEDGSRKSFNLNKVNDILTKCLENNIFTNEDINNLKKIIEHLKPKVADLNDLDQSNLKDTFKKIEENYPSFTISNYIVALKDIAALKNEPIKKEELWEFLFKADAGGQKLRKDFIKIGPWMKLISADKVNPGEQEKPALLDKMLSEFQFSNDKEDGRIKKRIILDFAKDLIQGGVIQREDPTLQKLIKLGLQEGSNEVASLAQAFNKMDENNEFLIRNNLITAPDSYDVRRDIIGPFITGPVQSEGQISDKISAKEFEELKKLRSELLVDQIKKIASEKVTNRVRKQFIEDFSRDLSILNGNLFKSIQPSEFVNKAWESKDKDKIAPNILEIIKSFNQLSSFIENQIVMKTEITKGTLERAHTIELFIEIADRLFTELHDYQGVLAIVAALNKGTVTAIIDKEKIMDLMPKKTGEKLKKLENITSNNKNYKNLKELIENDKKKGIPCVPILSIYMSEFTFIEEGNPNTQKEGINFEKASLLISEHEVIEESQALLTKQTRLHFDLVEEVIKPTFINEMDLYSRKKQIVDSLPKSTKQ